MTAADICNLALGHIGAVSIAALTDNTQEARKCNQYYHYVRKEALRAFEWNFSTKYINLATLAAVTPVGFSVAYQYPADCLKFRRIYLDDPTQEKQPFLVVPNSTATGKEIWTNLSGAKGVYTVDVTTEAIFDSQFVAAFSYLLASYIATPLTKSTQTAAQMLQFYGLKLLSAQAVDSQEFYGNDQIEDSLISARF